MFTVDRAQPGWLHVTPGWVRMTDVVGVDQAFEHFTTQLAHGESVFAYLGRARGWMQRRDTGRALTDVSEALRLDPQNARAVLLRGRIASEQGRYDDALAEFNRAVELAPQDPVPVKVRAWVWSGRGDYDRAIADLNAAITLMPTDAQVWGQRGWSYTNKGDYARPHKSG